MNNRIAVTVWILVLTGILSAISMQTPVLAQSVGSCEPSLGEAELDANNVRARILNNGMLFYRGEPHVYNIPRFSESNAIFAGAIWIAGRINGNLHASVARYGPPEFWAGPLDDNGDPPTDCNDYDRIFKVTRTDITDYESTGAASTDLSAWPTGLGAPTLSSSGTSVELLNLPLPARKDRVIDLSAGERPAIMGDQSLWWVMNDRGNKHNTSKSPPLGIEVHGYVFAARSGVDAINDATIYKYRLINRNTSQLEDAYFGFYLDPDLGDPGDDYVGSDSLLGIGFIYNADNYDEGREGYGSPPPALGVQFLLSPPAENDGLDNDHDGVVDEPGESAGMVHFARWVDGGATYESPQVGADYYNYLRGRWKNGERWTEGGYGHSFSDVKTNHIYPGDPVTGTYWSELNIDGLGTVNPTVHRDFMVSTGPFELAPGESMDIAFSIVWAKGEDHLASITKMKQFAEGIRIGFEANQLTNYGSPPNPGLPELSYEAELGHNYPDPFTDRTTIEYIVPHPVHVRLAVYDVLGREVVTLVQGLQEAGEYRVLFDGLGVPPGIYYYKIEIDHASKVLSMVLSK